MEEIIWDLPYEFNITFFTILPLLEDAKRNFSRNGNS